MLDKILDKIQKAIYYIGVTFGFCGLIYGFTKCDSISEKMLYVLGLVFILFVSWLLN